MKTFIIATILSVGVLLRPGMAPAANDTRNYDGGATTINAGEFQTAASVLSAAEMETAEGGGVVECDQIQHSNGDTYISCCVNLWLFRLCVEVNWTAVSSVLPF